MLIVGCRFSTKFSNSMTLDIGRGDQTLNIVMPCLFLSPFTFPAEAGRYRTSGGMSQKERHAWNNPHSLERCPCVSPSSLTTVFPLATRIQLSLGCTPWMQARTLNLTRLPTAGVRGEGLSASLTFVLWSAASPTLSYGNQLEFGEANFGGSFAWLNVCFESVLLARLVVKTDVARHD